MRGYSIDLKVVSVLTLPTDSHGWLKSENRPLLYVIVTALFPYFLVFSGPSPLLFTTTVYMVSNNKLHEIQ